MNFLQEKEDECLKNVSVLKLDYEQRGVTIMKEISINAGLIMSHLLESNPDLDLVRTETEWKRYWERYGVISDFLEDVSENTEDQMIKVVLGSE